MRRSAPSEIEFVSSEPDLIILNNCVQLTDTKFEAPFVKVLHDVWPEGDPEFRQFVLDKAESLYFSSPLHVGQFPHKFKAPYQVIPPAVNLTRFREAAPVRDKDVLWLAHNLSTLKGMNRAQRWAFENRTRVDYYGHNTIGGPVTHEQLPGLMSHYKRFLYLPNELEPFGLTVAEAWASGLELIVDESRVGAMWWIENRPQDVDRGSLMFWKSILDRFTIDSRPSE
jgi:glycosyltransferase involved in cell wall biosynthesis